jgi:uncharacterized membrane protein
MESIIVATFNEIADAQQGLNKLLQLDELDDITLYTLALVHKKQEGQSELLYYDGPDTKDLPVAGAVLGTLIGVIGGPIGMIVGMMAGSITGSLNKYNLETATQQFLRKIRVQLIPNKYILVMDVEEWNALLINTYLEPYHGVITRTALTDVYSNYEQEEWMALTQEIGPKGKALEKAYRKNKEAIQTKIQKLKLNRGAYNKKWKWATAYYQKHLQHKIEKLDQKLSASEGTRKESIQTRHEQLQEKLKNWQDQLARQHPEER